MLAMATLKNMTFCGRGSGCSLLILFYIGIVLALIITVQAVDEFLCSNDGYYAEGSDFESHLNTVLYSLVQGTSQTGFNTSVYGQIYGLLQCRGDTTEDQCYHCSQEANITIRQSCRNALGGRIWFDFCYLRYENYNFIGQGDFVGYYLDNLNNVSNPEVFKVALESLLSNLSAEAASGSKLYASGTTTDSLSRKIYGLVQCTSDISMDDCTTCLSNTINSISTSNSGAQGLMGSCIIRYDIDSFFNPIDLPLRANPAETRYPIPWRRSAFQITEVLPSSPEVHRGVCYSNGSCSPYPGDQPPAPPAASPAPSSAPPQVTSPAPRPAPPSVTDNTPAPSPVLDNTPETPPVPAPPHPAEATPPSDKSSNKILIILGVVGGLLLVLFVCLFSTWRRLKSAIFPRPNEGHEQFEEDTLIDEDNLISEGQQLIVFKMQTLISATGNFHDDNKLGEGGFGAVYKGVTGDGKEIAVKKLSLNSKQGKHEFFNEIKLVAKIQHRNLVKLYGCCTDGSTRLLVYEYLPNKSLDKILFDPNQRQQLDWPKRYNIILGVARGLLYLHQDSKPRIIHRDIKASNILLDDKLNPKIADFGLAKLFRDDETHVTTRVAGTYGYLAPEYAVQGQLTAKADVYSFGVLLLELITGRKNTDYSLPPEMQIILGWAWRSYERRNSVEIIDRAIIETCNEQQALRCIHVGLLCTQADSSLRPPMATVTLMLSSHSVTLPDPTRPFFPNSVSPINSGSGSSHASFIAPVAPVPTSNAYANSITELVPR